MNDCKCKDCDCNEYLTTHCHHTCEWAKQFDYALQDSHEVKTK